MHNEDEARVGLPAADRDGETAEGKAQPAEAERVRRVYGAVRRPPTEGMELRDLAAVKQELAAANAKIKKLAGTVAAHKQGADDLRQKDLEKAKAKEKRNNIQLCATATSCLGLFGLLIYLVIKARNTPTEEPFCHGKGEGIYTSGFPKSFDVTAGGNTTLLDGMTIDVCGDDGADITELTQVCLKLISSNAGILATNTFEVCASHIPGWKEKLKQVLVEGISVGSGDLTAMITVEGHALGTPLVKSVKIPFSVSTEAVRHLLRAGTTSALADKAGEIATSLKGSVYSMATSLMGKATDAAIGAYVSASSWKDWLTG